MIVFIGVIIEITTAMMIIIQHASSIIAAADDLANMSDATAFRFFSVFKNQEC